MTSVGDHSLDTFLPLHTDGSEADITCICMHFSVGIFVVMTQDWRSLEASSYLAKNFVLFWGSHKSNVVFRELV